jgi:hypothetical protein
MTMYLAITSRPWSSSSYKNVIVIKLEITWAASRSLRPLFGVNLEVTPILSFKLDVPFCCG